MSRPSRTDVEFLSKTAPVSMGDAWFEIASVSHFWIRRRFEVLRRMTGELPWKGLRVAEIGCGSGLLQRQCEDSLGIRVDGFDLNEFALRQNVARRSRVVCYDIADRLPELAGKYDVILLFDVLEHIDEEIPFLDHVLFHLKRGGRLIVNVPANQSLFSAYDRAAGHVRRYTGASLCEVLSRAGVSESSWTYWGLPLIPTLIVRKFLVRNQTDPDEILKRGFKPPSPLVNSLLSLVSRLEPIPQQLRGSSVMYVGEYRSASEK